MIKSKKTKKIKKNIEKYNNDFCVSNKSVAKSKTNKIFSLLSNSKQKIIAFLILAICVIFISNPSAYSASALNAISVWAVSVLPVLLPFFVFTRIIIELIPPKKSVLDKPFKKFYNAPDGSFLIFFLSALSGYPMGAKLISNFHEKRLIDDTDALSMLSYCSISGPMFMVGTVGVSIFLSYKAGIIILISNILACLFNGFVFRRKQDKTKLQETASIRTPKNEEITTENDYSGVLPNSVYDALNSILIVGVYIMLSFLLIDLLKNMCVIENIASTICGVFNIDKYQDVVESVLSGLIEITRGNIDLSKTGLNIFYKTIISSGLIGFGGLSVMMQSLSFIKKLHLPFKTIFKQKLLQGVFATIIAIPFALICF